jgi:hypothetical protein
MQRQLEPTATATSSVAVAVDILLPPDNLVLLNSTELASLIEGSSSLQLVATSAGSSGISLLAASGTADSQPTVTGSAPASSNLGLIAGLSVFSGCCVIMTAATAILYYRLRQKPITSHSKNIIIVDAPFSQTIRTAQPDIRVEFSPRNVETVFRRP